MGIEAETVLPTASMQSTIFSQGILLWPARLRSMNSLA